MAEDLTELSTEELEALSAHLDEEKAAIRMRMREIQAELTRRAREAAANYEPANPELAQTIGSE